MWVSTSFPTDQQMQDLAAELGYSETVFAIQSGTGQLKARYFSPQAEVSFCGHATIALGVSIGAGESSHASYTVETGVGDVKLDVELVDGQLVAALTSVDPSQRSAPPSVVSEALEILDWSEQDLDPAIPPTIAYAGAHHLVLAVRDRTTLARLDYDFARLQELMLINDLTTLQLVWEQDEHTFHARNPFPVGGVVEDPATGAAAAAFGGYLRTLRPSMMPIDLVIHQGHDMGRPSKIDVQIPTSGGIRVAGSAAQLPD